MKILAAQPLPDFQLRLTFSDGTDGVVNSSDFAARGVFEAWLQPGVFEQASVTSHGALSWPGDLDLCPDALYLKATGKQPEEVLPGLAQKMQKPPKIAPPSVKKRPQSAICHCTQIMNAPKTQNPVHHTLALAIPFITQRSSLNCENRRCARAS